MTAILRALALLALLICAGADRALAAEACAPDSYQIVTSPDGTSLSILFDSMIAEGTSPRRFCSLHVPLNLPEGESLGVYRVDYRGFAHLSGKGFAALAVDYRFGPNKVRRFHRKIKGPTSDDFLFTENIGAGLMKRAGCGADASLDVQVGLELPSRAAADDLAALDSADGAPKGGIVYHLNIKKC